MSFVIPEERCAELVVGYLDGKIDSQQLKADRSRSLVIRLRPEGQASVVLKLWSRPSVRGMIRRLTGTSPLQRECRALLHLRRAGARVPAALGVWRTRGRNEPWTDCLLLEDMGVCRGATEHVKALIAARQEADLDRFLADVVELTHCMFCSGIVDTDHSFINTVATPEGRAARLDFELARVYRCPVQRFSSAHVRMVAMLIGTYAFAVQPAVGRVNVFAERLARRLRLSPRVLRKVQRRVEWMMEYQRNRSGIDTRVHLPWDGKGPPTGNMRSPA